MDFENTALLNFILSGNIWRNSLSFETTQKPHSTAEHKANFFRMADTEQQKKDFTCLASPLSTVANRPN